jgi:P27 family predicted phage terminase small subunit
MARTRKADAIKELQGTMQECRRKTSVPKVPVVSVLPLPVLPLSARAMEHRELVASQLLKYKILTELDFDALDMYAQVFDMYLDLIDEIKKPKRTQFVIKSERGNIKNPIFSIQNLLFAQLHACQIKLGLTPADRVKIHAEIAESKDDNPYSTMQNITQNAGAKAN